MTGVSAEEMIGQGDYAYTIPFYGKARPFLMDLLLMDNKELATKYQKIERIGNNIMVEVFCKTLYGNMGAWVFVKTAPLQDQHGNIIGAIEILRDISAQKLAETYREVGKEVLLLLNKPGDLKEIVQLVVTLLKKRTGFDAAGIRLQEGCS